MLEQQLVPRPHFKTNASILYNYKAFLTELKYVTQKEKPVRFKATDLAKKHKVKSTIFRALVKLKVIKIEIKWNLDGEKGRMHFYQWVLPVEITDKFVQKVYDKALDENRKMVVARKEPDYVPQRYSVKTGLPKSKPGKKSKFEEVKKLLDERNQADDIVAVEIEKGFNGKRAYNKSGLFANDKPRIKVSGILFAPKQLKMMGEKRMEKKSTVLVDRCFTYEGVTKIMFEYDQSELKVLFVKESRIKIQQAFGINPDVWDETFDILGTLTLKNKTIAMSERFSDDKQGSFWIETVEL